MTQTTSLSSEKHRALSAEASHRISNHLAMVVGLINAQISGILNGPTVLTRERVADLLRETSGKVISIAHLHRRLAQQPQDELIDLSNFLIEIVSELATALSFGARLGVRQQLSSGCLVDSEQARTLGLLVGEVVMNAVKHAHPTGLATEIGVACSKAADGSLELDIFDDGVGLPEHFDPAKDGGTGFKLIRMLAQSLDAGLRIESSDLGLVFHLRVPAAQISAPSRNEAAIDSPRREARPR